MCCALDVLDCFGALDVVIENGNARRRAHVIPNAGTDEGLAGDAFAHSRGVVVG